jgi:hypothetical protein
MLITYKIIALFYVVSAYTLSQFTFKITLKYFLYFY